MFTFVARKCGDAAEHALLLCGSLLGYGMNAYVCQGEGPNGKHTWVLTRGAKRTLLWESISGLRLDTTDSNLHRYFRKVGCVFNPTKFFANVQVDDTVIHTEWDLENPNHWKPMDPEMIDGLLPIASPQLPLLPPMATTAQAEVDLERELKGYITQYRNQREMITIWDEDLAYLLTPALVNYELDRIGSITYGNDEF